MLPKAMRGGPDAFQPGSLSLALITRTVWLLMPALPTSMTSDDLMVKARRSP